MSCQLFQQKKMDCQIGNGTCAICVKVPCLGGGGNCGDVKIECCKPNEMEKCCQSKSGANSCCVCALVQDGAVAKVMVECCGTRQELAPTGGNAVCVCVPQKEGGKCGSQVKLVECQPGQLDKCCKENTASGDCCCVCVQFKEGTAQALVSCPESGCQPMDVAGCCGKSVPCY